MNNRQLATVLRQQYRKYAIRVSLIVHLVGVFILSFFFIKSEVYEGEDEIQVDLFPQLPQQQIVKKQPIPKIKVETPIPKEETPITEKKMLEKPVKVLTPKPALQIAKMPASDTPRVPVKPIDIPTLPAALKAADVSTDAELTPVPDAVLSPVGGAGAGERAEKNYIRRKETGARTPGKGTGSGIADRIKGRGAGKAAGTGTGDIFRSILQQLTDGIIQSSGGGPIDVVFVVDASGSMGDNINAVAEYLADMIDTYKKSKIDYQLGLTHFNTDGYGKNSIRVFQLTRGLSQYKQNLYAIIPAGDENALDAIHQTLIEMRLRRNTTKHFILVTDEEFTSLLGYTVEDTIAACQRNEIRVNVLGNNTPEHKLLATQTSGTWHAIPQDPKPKNIQQPHKTYTALNIGEKIRQDAANIPTDVVFFIDGSKSMENKMTYLKEHIDLWIRDWNNARIDYKIGVVRFRTYRGINRVNVFNPPQTQNQIHAVLRLQSVDDENLLHAIVEGARRIKIRPEAKTHFIVFTDEPGDPNYPITDTIQLLKEIPVVVSVIGTHDNFQQQVAWQTGGMWVVIPNGHQNNQSYH